MFSARHTCYILKVRKLDLFSTVWGPEGVKGILIPYRELTARRQQKSHENAYGRVPTLRNRPPHEEHVDLNPLKYTLEQSPDMY